MGQLNYTTVKTNELLEKIEGFPESVSDGKTPVFVIGTVSTLDPGMSATASVTQDGVDDQGNPKYKLNFGIPKGLDGAGGGGGGVADSVQWANVLNKPTWLNRSTKPTYTASEVGALPATTIIPSKVSQLTNDSGFLTSSGFKTINGQSIVGSGNISITGGGGTTVTSTAWADITGKPAWIGPTKPTYTASEVGALPASTTIPSKTSQLFNDSDYTTSTSFKTINGESIVGSGNIVIESSGGGGTPSGGTGNVKVTNASDLGKDYYYAFKPSENGSAEGTFSLIPDATESKEGLMSASNYRKLYDMKPVIALPIAVLGYNAETTSETIEAMLQTAFGMTTGSTAVYFIYIAGTLQGEYNSSFQKFYIGDRECMLGGNVVEDGSSVSQATLEFSYVDGGKLHTVAITLVVSSESGDKTYTYSAKVLESGDDTYYLPAQIVSLSSGASKAEIDNAFGGEGKFSEAITAALNKKKLYIYSNASCLIPVSSNSLVGLIGKLSFLYAELSSGTERIKTIEGDSVRVIYPSGYPLNSSLLDLLPSSTSDEISTAVGGELGLKAIIQAVKDGNRLFFRETGENDVVSLAYLYSVNYSVSDNGDMSFAFGYCVYAVLGFSNIGFAINYTKSSNTFTCNKTTA